MSSQGDEIKLLFNVADRLEVIEKIVEGGDESKLMSAIRRASRERRLMADETASSEQINATAAERLLSIRDGLDERKDEIRLLADSAKSELLTKERSAKTSAQLLQTRQADVEEQLANFTQQLQELTNVVGQVDSNRQRNEQLMGQMEGRLKQLLEDGQFRKELRDIARKEVINADKAFVMGIAQRAIRQALDSVVIPPQLQPKPERLTGAANCWRHQPPPLVVGWHCFTK